MLDKSQLIDLFDRLGTPSQGRDLVLRARIEAPVRKTQSRGGNVITLFSSRKMGCEIRTESRHIEFAAAVDKEYDAQVLEYYPQPCELKLELIDAATGEIHRIKHTPDFLVITPDGLTLEEWKPHDRLLRLAQKYPYRYVQDSDGRWSSPLIEGQLAALGLRYRLMTDAGLPRKRVENYLFLEDYFGNAAQECPFDVLQRLKALLTEDGTATLHQVLSPPYDLCADHVYKAIADGLLAVDFDHEALNQPRSFKLYRDATLRDFMKETPGTGFPGQSKFVADLAPGAVFGFESQELTISLVGESEVVFNCADGTTRTMQKQWLIDAIDRGRVTPTHSEGDSMLDLTRFTEEDFQIALARQALLKGERKSHSVSSRTERRWRSRKTAAASNGAHEVLALVPNTRARGNRTSRLNEDQEAMLLQVYERHWRTTEAKNYKTCYRFLEVACASEGIKCPSYPTLILYLKSWQTKHDVRTRHGKRMAYQQGEFIDVLHLDTPVHGSRPLQYVHIDHTELDLELVSSRTGKPLGKAWLTIAIDAYSRRIVGLYLTFEPPSYRSVMMILRDIVRRFNRLPQFFVVDNGKDLISDAFESFLNVMGTHQRLRPAGRPRHGAVMERIFGRANTEYIHNLAGNTKAMKHVRMTTGKHQPVNFAEWTLESAYYGLCYWAFEYYEQELHPALGRSPREAFDAGLRESGPRDHRRIQLNKEFLVATCPPVDRGGMRQVNKQRGVKVGNMHFWHADFGNPRWHGQMVRVRYDPWDASSAYVWLDGRWVRAMCRSLVGLGQLTEVEIQAVSAEYSARFGKALDVDDRKQRLTEFMKVFTPQGAMAKKFDQQAEQKGLLDVQGGGSVNPVDRMAKTPVYDDLEDEVQELAPVPDFQGGLSESATVVSKGRAAQPLAPDADLPDFDTF